MEHSKANIEWLKDIVKECREISGQWNGDNAGRLEDRAGTADEIAEKCHEIIELINYLDEN